MKLQPGILLTKLNHTEVLLEERPEEASNFLYPFNSYFAFSIFSTNQMDQNPNMKGEEENDVK